MFAYRNFYVKHTMIRVYDVCLQEFLCRGIFHPNFIKLKMDSSIRNCMNGIVIGQKKVTTYFGAMKSRVKLSLHLRTCNEIHFSHLLFFGILKGSYIAMVTCPKGIFNYLLTL